MLPFKYVYVLLGIGLSLGPSSIISAQSSHHQIAKIGVLVDLHEPGSWIGKAGRKNACGSLNIHAYQQLAAVKWATEIINNKSWPGEFALDVAVHDTCGESGIALSETHQLLNLAKENLETPLIGVIVIGSRNNERIIDRPLESLNNENISAIVTSARAAGLVLSKHPNVFTTAPDISSVAEGIVALINQLGATNVAVVSTCSHALKRFKKLSAVRSIKVDNILTLERDSPKILDALIKFLRKDAAEVQSVVLLLESTELEGLINDGNAQAVEEFQQLVLQKSWILGSVGLDHELIKDWSSKFHSNLLVIQPHASINSDFNSYFVEKLSESLAANPDKEILEYIQGMYHCQGYDDRMSGSKPNSLIPACKNLSKTYFTQKLHLESDIGFIVNAVSVYSAALRLAQLESCKNDTSCDHSELSARVIEALRKLNLPVKDTDYELDPTESTVATSHELEGTRGRINYHGKLISPKYDLYLSKASGLMSQIGQYSNEDGLVLDVMVGINLEGGTIMQDGNGLVVKSSGKGSNGNARVSMRRGKTKKHGRESKEYLRQQLEESVNVRRMMSPPEFYISRVWAMVVTAVAITGVFISLYMLVYVLQRMCDGTLHGNQVLGILLLLGIIMMYASVVLFVLPPGILLCNLRVFLPSIATAICFGILLLKAMQLRALVSLGLGGRVSALNQFITLVFIVAVQVAIDVQWYLNSHPIENFDYQTQTLAKGLVIQECFFSHHHYLYLHSYLGCLIMLVFFYGTSVLKIRRNYNEAKWITLASCLSLPIAVAWAVAVHTGPSDFQEPSACVAFISIATVLLFSVFIPKLSTISQQSSLARKKKMLKSVGPGYTGSISTIFTTLSDRGTLQSHISQKRNSSHPYLHHQNPNYSSSTNHNSYIPPAPPMPSVNGKSVTYSPRLTTNFYHSSSAATSLARSGSMKTPFFDSGRAAYP